MLVMLYIMKTADPVFFAASLEVDLKPLNRDRGN